MVRDKVSLLCMVALYLFTETGETLGETSEEKEGEKDGRYEEEPTQRTISSISSINKLSTSSFPFSDHLNP